MPITVFQTIANQLVNNPYEVSPISKGSGRDLLSAINSDQKYPGITEVGGIGDVLAALVGDDINSDLKKLTDSISSANPLALLEALLTVAVDLPGLVEGFLSHQVEVAASIISFVNVVQNPVGAANALESAYGDYFFGGGYNTVPDQKISPPALPFSSSTAKDIIGFFSQKTGERYVRDLIRVGIEAMGNYVWKLADCYNAIDKTPAIKNQAKAKAWFSGFSDYAESAVTAAVEQAAQGVSTFQSNPLIAASVATAAGTSARKAAQTTFFAELGIHA
jgi:hypothetical protein